MRKEILAGVKWNAINQVFNLGSKFVVTIFLSRLLGPADFGLIALIFTFTAIADNFTEGGFKNAIIQETNVTQKELSSIFFMYITVGLILCSLTIISAPLISKFYNQSLTLLTIVVAFTYLINPLAFIQEALLQKELKFKALAISQMVSKTLGAIMGISMAYMGYGVWALIWSMHTSAIIRTLMLFGQRKWMPYLHFKWIDLKKYWKVGSNIFFSGLLFNITNRIDYLIMGKFFTPTDLGLYSRAKENGFLPALIFGNVIRGTFLGVYAKIKTDTEQLKKMFIDSSNAIFILVTVGCFSLAMFTHEIILVLFGAKWLAMEGMMQLYTLYVFVYCISVNRVYLLNAIGRTDIDFKLGLIFTPIRLVLLLCPVLFSLSINPYYFIGVNISFLIGALFVFDKVVSKHLKINITTHWHYWPIALILGVAIIIQLIEPLTIAPYLLQKIILFGLSLGAVSIIYYKSIQTTWLMFKRK